MSAAARASKPSRRELLTLIVILGAALIVRTLLASLDRVIRWDEPDYLTLGINLFSGKGYTTGVVPELHYTPFYPIVTGLLHLIVRNAELASNLVYMAAGTLLIVPVYAIARRFYGRRTALTVACLLAVFPALSASVLYWGTMTEPLYILLLFSAFYAALLGMEDDKPWAFVAAGALLSLAYLTRPEGIITFCLLLAYLIFVRLVQRRLVKRRTILALVGFVLAFAIVAAPYLGWLYVKSGRLLITGKLGLTYAMGQTVIDKDPAAYDKLISSLDETGLEVVWYSPERFNYSVVDDLLADPAGFVHRTGVNARILAGQFISHTVFPTALGAPLLLGLMNVAWDRRRLRRELLLLTAVAAPLVSFLPFHIEIRFFAPLMPVLLIWVAHGLEAIGTWLAETWNLLGPAVANQGRRQRLSQILAVLPLALVLAYLVAVIPLAVSNGRQTLDWTHKQAGLWLKSNTPAGASVMARDLAIAVYAERPFVPSPNADVDEAMAYARYHQANYYVVDDYEITKLRPLLTPLLDTKNPPQGLVHEETLTDGTLRTIIYRIP